MSRSLALLFLVSFIVVGLILVLAKNSDKSKTDTSKGQLIFNFEDLANKINNNPNGIPVNQKSQQVSPTAAPQQITQLIVQDLQTGTSSASVQNGDTVVVNYIGYLTNGTKFDSSYDRNEPFSFTIGAGQVIAGWDQGIIGMKLGGKRRLGIPPDLAYGEQGIGPVPPNAALIFDIDLIEIKAPQEAQ